jgi:hypothetical protein
MKGFFFVLIILFQVTLVGQSPLSIRDLKIKSEAFNHFSAIVYGMNNEKGDRDVYLSLFDSENVNFIDDELSLQNDNYSHDIKIGEFQDKVANRLKTEIKDDDWCGMPFFVGTPLYTDGDSMGNIDIVVKHLIENISGDTKFSDTQVLIIKLNFKEIIYYDEDYNVKTKFHFKINNVALHRSYHRPHFLHLSHNFKLSSFGKALPIDLKITPDSVLINNIIPINNDLINLKSENLLSESELNITSFAKGDVFSKTYVPDLNKITDNVDFTYNRSIGELGFKYYGNLISTDRYLVKNRNYNNALGWFSNESYALNLQFPVIRKNLKIENSKYNISPSSLSYIVIDIGYTNSTANLKIQNLIESGSRIDVYNNVYNRFANYLLYQEEKIENQVFLNLGYQKRQPLSDKIYFFSSGLVNLSRVTNNQFSYSYDVRYTGVYDQYYQISISENGIMDYGEFLFEETMKPTLNNKTLIATILDMGIGINMKKFNFQIGLVGFLQLHSKQSSTSKDEIGVDFGVFSHHMKDNVLEPKNFIGNQIRLNIYL